MAVWAALLVGPAAAQAPAASRTDVTSAVDRVASSDRVRAAVRHVGEGYDRLVEEIVTLTEIPAPPFHEAARAQAFLGMLKESGIRDAAIDEEGNVVGLRRGSGNGPLLVISSHLDTVFPEGTNVKVRREGTKLHAPGVGDASRYLAILLAMVRALDAAEIQTESDILFVATVGEEGLGDLRGVKHLFTKGAYKDRIKAFISLDILSTEGNDDDKINNGALGSKRYRVTFKGPGGHSFQAFGLVNPAFAMGSAIRTFSEIKVPADPKTTFNVGVLGGGTSVNAIPFETWMDIDMRSASPDRLDALTEDFKSAMLTGAAEENARRSTKDGPITVDLKLIGDRPSGLTAVEQPLVEIASAVMRRSGLTPSYRTTSTDANIPISLGIPAITIAAGGNGSGYHSLGEWTDVDKAPSVKGIETALIVLLTAAKMR
ncbi:M20/M25/M40 family metallo-hydrolase [Methylobacterium planeticum]|uniref:M20/M25/M40 family metallo-hydrolase n=2 Tax=Methylobacterium planeticum TaxID=2615211 RepID=A0A6N6MGM2_9HYPH|nr:M20/M25/M40 family metallo-hydrolase [Methylobacterium planeticum]